MGVEEVENVKALIKALQIDRYEKSDSHGPQRSTLIRKRLGKWIHGAHLGGGSFGNVFEVLAEDGSFCAVKEVLLDDQTSLGEERVKQLQHEISLLSEFHHENIVPYLGTERDDSKLYIFLELEKGSLATLYNKYELLDSHVSAYTRQILSGLIYLHERNVVHRDIKCANILVDTNGSVKLADFGLAKKLTDFMSCQGSPYWIAPEVVNSEKGNGYGVAADIWSLGCVVLEMLTRKIPYSGLGWCQAIMEIGKGELPQIPNTLSVDANDFILTCLRVDPDLRPSAAELLGHPYVRSKVRKN